MTPEQRAAVANAARDMCRTFMRLERDLERFTGAVRDAGGAGTPGIGQAVTQGLGTPQLREAWSRLQAGIVGSKAPAEGDAA